ncbi:M16 family metallopeptidase [Montanilutibacter psychrotolerans]|uniref:Insulinase family protein n=1 Tax=Montanilutibacter psychrotolerans TaxID=1327343 RepID=A0A3M8SYI9_9GAMM|nr:pitrilysin family protein [Lysobacter psychrotolerans]RNF86309.1 insulinase family protein [Lysobacter psychrotolerans]
MQRLLPVALAAALILAGACAHATASVSSSPAPAVGASQAISAAAAGTATRVPGRDTIVSRTLGNGLKVVVWPDHDIPSVAYYTFYRVGGRNEYPGITGLAHYFEHMMFNGTSRRAPGEFDRTMEAAGGSNNAYTSNDLTVYQDWFPVSALELIFDLEGDRMANLAFDPKVVESERGVVFSERRSSIDNDNFGSLAEQMQATAYTAHPYQFPVIGWPSDIENWKADDLKRFYRTYYAPNNATVFVVGAVEPEQVFALAEKYLAGIARQPAPTPITTVEPEQQGERRLVLEKADAQSPLLAYAFHTGLRANDADRPALDLLARILAQGESSRLHQRLVEREQAAIDVGTYDVGDFDPGLLYVYAVLAPDGDLGKVERLLDEELARIARDGVTADELAKARNLDSSAFWRGLATISGKAQALGTYEVFHGDYGKLFDAPAAVEAVTGERIQALAKRIFRNQNRTVGTLKPVAAKENQP